MTALPDNLQTITLGGGCFWCTEAVFVQVRGVLDVESGYSNGHVQRPSYENVCTGRTGHNEVVKLVYDPQQISTREILEIFFVIHDPTTLNRQGNDSGTQYRSGIYFSDPAQQDSCHGRDGADGCQRRVQPPDRDRGHAAGQLLAGGGLPPGLL
jgi:peptide-methionine (S)-S-oxide reductase